MPSLASKALLALLSASLLALPLTGCGSSRSSSDTSGDAEQTEQAATDDQAAEESAPAADSEYQVSIDSAQVAQNYEGSPAVIVTYTFTNNSDEATSFALACSAKVFQNGVECDTTFGDGYDSGTSMKDLQPGATTQIQLMYELTDMSPIDVQVEEMFSFDDVMLAQKTFNLE